MENRPLNATESNMVMCSAIREVLVNFLIQNMPTDRLEATALGVTKQASDEQARRLTAPPAADAIFAERHAVDILEAIGAIYADAAGTRVGMDIRGGATPPRH